MEEDNPFTKSKTIDPEVRAYVYSLVNAVSSRIFPYFGRLMKNSSEERTQMRLASTFLVTMLLPCFAT